MKNPPLFASAGLTPFCLAVEKFAEMYLYLSSATLASRSSPYLFCISASTARASLLPVSSSSPSMSFIAWNTGEFTPSSEDKYLSASARGPDSASRTHVSPFLVRGISSARLISSFMPVSLSAETGTTGTPILLSRVAASTISPDFSTASIILSAIITGTSISNSWVVR